MDNLGISVDIQYTFDQGFYHCASLCRFRGTTVPAGRFAGLETPISGGAFRRRRAQIETVGGGLAVAVNGSPVLSSDSLVIARM